MQVENNDADEKAQRRSLEDPVRNIKDMLKKEQAFAGKIERNSKAVKNISHVEKSIHAAKLVQLSGLMDAMAEAGDDESAFLFDPKKGRLVVPPKTSFVCVTATQSNADEIGDREASDVLKTEYKRAGDKRNKGLHKTSHKIDTTVFGDAIGKLPEAEAALLALGLAPKHSYDPMTDERTTAPLDDDPSKLEVVIGCGPDDFWTPAQKLARLVTGFVEGDAHTSFRGNHADDKSFWLLTGALAHVIELPEQGSEDAQKLAARMHRRFFVRCDDANVEPLLATDGMPVRNTGAMREATEQGEVYVRTAGEPELKYELVYTIAMPPGMQPFQCWNAASQDYRDIRRCSPKMLGWITDLTQKLLGGERGEKLPPLIKHWMATNPACKEVLNVNDAAIKTCPLWRHPTQDDFAVDAATGEEHVDPDRMTEIVEAWATSPFCNPVVAFANGAEGGDPASSSSPAAASAAKRVMFASTPEERALLQETMLRVGPYDSELGTAPSVKELRKTFLPVWGAVVCLAMGYPIGKQSTASTAIAIRNDAGGGVGAPDVATPATTAARGGNGKRKASSLESASALSDAKYASIVASLEAVGSSIQALSDKFDDLEKRFAAEEEPAKRFRFQAFKRIKAIQKEVEFIAASSKQAEDAEDGEDGEGGEDGEAMD